MASTSYQEIRDSMRQLYLEDPRPWLVGFSGGKDSTMVASLVFDAVLSVPPDQRKKPAVRIANGELQLPNGRMLCSAFDTRHSSLVTLPIHPVTVFVNQRLGHWGEAILHLGARRAENSTRAQTMAGREARNGLSRHPDLPRVWVSNPIQFLTTEEVWAYLLQKPNPWGGDWLREHVRLKFGVSAIGNVNSAWLQYCIPNLARERAWLSAC